MEAKIRKRKMGFTMVEVILFLAISSSIIIGIIASTNATIARQRYSDSVNDFADFLRGIYSQVMDVEHNNTGNSGTAVYGKLITFREVGNNTDTAYIYDVVGNVVNSANSFEYGSDTLSILSRISVRTDNKAEYTIPWEAFLEHENSTISSEYDTPNNTHFVGTVMIVRSPISGIVRTFTASGDEKRFDPRRSNPLLDYITSGKFTTDDIDFCLDSADNNYDNRRDIRLTGGGINSTAVNMVAMDGEDSRCKGNN